jgi:hypothetical protein
VPTAPRAASDDSKDDAAAFMQDRQELLHEEKRCADVYGKEAV